VEPGAAANEDAALEAAKDSLTAFASRFQTAYLDGLRRKIGLSTAQEGDEALVQDFLQCLANDGVDFTLAFRTLSGAIEDETTLRVLFTDKAALDAWMVRWRERLAQGPDAPAAQALMKAVNPAYIPRNHLVEAALTAAVEQGDYGPFETLLGVLSHPYRDDPALTLYTLGPREEEKVLQTFCGT
jgi:uncharacterized protein YdiU (UPF0061 family)